MKKTLWFLCFLMMLCVYSAYASQEPVAQRTELDDGYRIDYVNASGDIVISDKEGYATKIVTYYELNARTEMYYDAQGLNTAISNGAYGRYIVNVDSDKMHITYLDADGVPMVTQSGYTAVLRTVENGQLMQEMYLDGEDKPMSLSEGQYGYKRDYDDNGRITSIIYLDKNGMPAKTYRGYDEIRREYDENGQLTYMWYYLNGNQITLKSGQSGILKTDGKEIPVDRNGNRIFILTDFLKQNHWICWIAAICLIGIGLMLPRRLKLLLLICYCVFIAYMTILTREHTAYRINLELFWSYKQFLVSSGRRLEVLNNVLLFVPFAALLFSLWPRFWRVCTVTILVSILIEVVQLVLRAGVCQLDDVLNNGLGGLLGIACGAVGNKLNKSFAREKECDNGDSAR